MYPSRSYSRWLNHAEKFYLGSLDSYNHQRYNNAVHGFHVATENYLKSVLLFLGLELKETHDLTHIVNRIADKVSDFPDISEECKVLERYGHIAEYPSDESLEEEDVISCLHSIEVVKKVCIDFINANGLNILGGGVTLEESRLDYHRQE